MLHQFIDYICCIHYVPTTMVKRSKLDWTAKRFCSILWLKLNFMQRSYNTCRKIFSRILPLMRETHFGQLDNTPNQTIAELGMRLKKFKSVNRRGTKKHSWIASPCHNSPILIVYYIAIGAGIMTRWNYKKHCWSSFERACLNCSSWCMHTDYSSNMAYPLLKCSRYAVV